MSVKTWTARFMVAGEVNAERTEDSRRLADAAARELAKTLKAIDGVYVRARVDGVNRYDIHKKSGEVGHIVVVPAGERERVVRTSKRARTDDRTARYLASQEHAHASRERISVNLDTETNDPALEAELDTAIGHKWSRLGLCGRHWRENREVKPMKHADGHWHIWIDPELHDAIAVCCSCKGHGRAA